MAGSEDWSESSLGTRPKVHVYYLTLGLISRFWACSQRYELPTCTWILGHLVSFPYIQSNYFEPVHSTTRTWWYHKYSWRGVGCVCVWGGGGAGGEEGCLGEAKVSCILCHRAIQLILAYSWARLAKAYVIVSWDVGKTPRHPHPTPTIKGGQLNLILKNYFTDLLWISTDIGLCLSIAHLLSKNLAL